VGAPRRLGRLTIFYHLKTIKENNMQKAGRIPALVLAALVLITAAAGCGVKDNEKKDMQTTSAAKTAQPGDIIEFGAYEQDNNTANGKEAIAWRVLAVQDGKRMLLSDKILDVVPYHDNSIDITWGKCNLRAWLNKGFYQAAFGSAEQARILTTHVDTADYPGPLEKGEITKDKVFLLSYQEAQNPEYGFSADSGATSTRLTVGTPYAVGGGLWVQDRYPEYSGYSNWYLRTPNRQEEGVCSVGFDGLISWPAGVGNEDGFFGIRPALWIAV